MGREYFAVLKESKKRPRSVSPKKEQHTTCSKDERDVKYFLPIRLIAQLRRLIAVLEAENKTDEQKLLELKDAIGKRGEKIIEYQERIRSVSNQMNY